MKKIALLPILIFLTAVALFIVISNYKSPKDKDPKQATANKMVTDDKKTTGGSTPNTPTITSAPVVTAALDLIIISPVADSTVSTSSVVVKGKVNPKAYVIINEYDLTPGKDGSFEQRINLDEGENYISVVAYDDDGNSSERELLVVRTVEGI